MVLDEVLRPDARQMLVEIREAGQAQLAHTQELEEASAKLSALQARTEEINNRHEAALNALSQYLAKA